MILCNIKLESENELSLNNRILVYSKFSIENMTNWTKQLILLNYL